MATRREFLTGSAAAGLGLGLAGFSTSGCTGTDSAGGGGGGPLSFFVCGAGGGGGGGTLVSINITASFIWYLQLKTSPFLSFKV